jgi:DNA-binding LytR/AlgR family response regulator
MTSQSSQGQACRVLVVEDNFLMAEMLCDLLRGHGCEIVGPAPRLASALALVASREIDGALLDINLGGEFCFPLAEMLQAKGVPFVFVTGYADRAVVPASLRGVPVVVKPFNPLEIASILHSQFGQPAPS